MPTPGAGGTREFAPGLHRCRNMESRFKKSFSMDLIRILLSILVPPLGVFLQVGIGLQFWINIVLTLLGYVPGVIHAIYIILKR